MMIKATIDYVQAVKAEIFYCDEFCNELAELLKAVNNDVPSADEIKKELQRLYEMGETSVIQSLLERSLTERIDDKESTEYSIESNNGLNLKIRFLVNEKANELTDLKVGLIFKN